MKVLLVNGSSRPDGCTSVALREAARALEGDGIETEMLFIGNRPLPAFMYKPAAAVLSARRAGQVASFDVINKYFTILSMPVVASTYWNLVYGAQPEQVEQDKEGLATMQNLGHNMAWMLRCIELGRANGVIHPENVKVLTNFIR